jgi:hypothetical protein
MRLVEESNRAQQIEIARAKGENEGNQQRAAVSAVPCVTERRGGGETDQRS